MAILIVFVVWQVIYLASKYWGFDVVAEMRPGILDTVEVISISVFAMWGLLWLPFKRHEEEALKHAHEIAALRKEIKNRELQKVIKNALGDFHIELSRRVREIRDVSFMGYKEKYPDSYNRTIDADTQRLLNQIKAYLKTTIGQDAVAVFEDTTQGIKETPVEDQGSLIITEPLKYWHLVMDRLNHYAAQLMKVIEQYIASRSQNT